MDELFYLEDLLSQIRCIEIDLHTDDECDGKPTLPMGCMTLETDKALGLALKDKVVFKIKWVVESIEKIEDKHLGGKDRNTEYDNNYYRYRLEPVKEEAA